MQKKHFSINMGKSYSLYKVLRLKGHETLAPLCFPNLFKVANTCKRSLDGTFRDYKSNKESLSCLSNKDVEEAVSRPPIKKSYLGQNDFVDLKSAFRLTEDELTQVVAEGDKTSTSSLKC